MRAALLLLLVVALVEAGSMAPQRLVQAFELDRPGRVAAAPVELTLWVTPPTYTGRPPVRLEAERVATGQPLTIRAPLGLPAGSEALAQLHHLADAAEQFSLTLDDKGPAFATVGEDSAEASLVIEQSGSLRVGVRDRGAGHLGARGDPRPGAHDRVRRDAAGDPEGRAALRLRRRGRLRRGQHRAAARAARATRPTPSASS